LQARARTEEGQDFTANDIHECQAAELDARERCGFDDTISKTSYYATEEDDGNKSILIYENPDVDLSTVPSGGAFAGEYDRGRIERACANQS